MSSIKSSLIIKYLQLNSSPLSRSPTILCTRKGTNLHLISSILPIYSTRKYSNLNNNSELNARMRSHSHGMMTNDDSNIMMIRNGEEYYSDGIQDNNSINDRYSNNYSTMANARSGSKGQDLLHRRSNSIVNNSNNSGDHNTNSTRGKAGTKGFTKTVIKVSSDNNLEEMEIVSQYVKV